MRSDKIPFAFSVIALIAMFACRSDVSPLAPSRSSVVNSAQPIPYRVTDLGTLGGDSILAWRINERGQVIGWGTTASGLTHAFVWTTAGGLVDLGALGPGNASHAWGINDSGVVVGEIDLPSGKTRAFIWTASEGMRDLGTLGGDVALAQGINNRGQVVGFSTLAGDATTHGFVWTAHDGMKDAGTLNGANTRLRSINESGMVGTGTGQGQAVIWTRATGFQGLGFLPGGSYSYGARINSQSQIAGFGDTDIATHAFRWTQGTGMVDLGSLSGPSGQSEALDISDDGGIVGGTTTVSDPSHLHAFLWSAAQGMQQLTAPTGAIVDEAYGLNEARSVVGYADFPDGHRHALLWSPNR
jgi:probable HAF family extracellular repeat protein